MRRRMEIDGAVFTRVRPLMGCRRPSARHRLIPYVGVRPFLSSGATCLSVRPGRFTGEKNFRVEISLAKRVCVVGTAGRHKSVKTICFRIPPPSVRKLCNVSRDGGASTGVMRDADAGSTDGTGYVYPGDR